MRTTRLAAAAAALVVGCPLVAGATLPTPNAVPALSIGTVPYDATARLAAFPVRDAAGTAVGSRTWRLTDAGGNCCESYVLSTPQGDLVDVAGNLPVISSDQGRTWRRVDYPVPGLGGEGTMVVAPNGDLAGVTWDPYVLDSVVAFRFERATGTWSWVLNPLHTPVFDRPWVSVVPGPFTDTLGTSHPYAFLMIGGVGELKQVLHLSFDGLHYDELALPAVDTKLATAGVGVLPHPAYPAADWLQTLKDAPVYPLNGGGALVRGAFTTTSGCSWQRIIPPSTALGCVAEAPPSKALKQDSRGVLTRVGSSSASALLFETSRDGGATWQSAALTSPWAGGTVERHNPGDPAAAFAELAVNGALGMAVVATRIARPSGGVAPGQDVVYVIDTSGLVPRVAEVLEVGVGGLETAGGLAVQGSAARLDFYSVAILPDGKVATGYFDTTTAGGPQIAVETGVTRAF